MWKYIFIVIPLFVFVSCEENNTQTKSKDSVADTILVTETSQLDISGPVEVVLTHGETESTTDNGITTYVLRNYKDNDTLLIRYVTSMNCEECRLETQIWRGDKYVDLVRDTGYGTGNYTRIPVSLLQRCSQDGSAEFQQLGLYLSVRQYHPVETGNKRFLFYLNLR